jgi:hypothetical protein
MPPEIIHTSNGSKDRMKAWKVKNMKTALTVIVSAMLMTQSFGQHTGGGPVSLPPDERTPEIVQTSVISRTPVYEWRGTEGTVEEMPDGTMKTIPGKQERVLTGYNVVYRVVYDNGTSSSYTEFESQ